MNRKVWISQMSRKCKTMVAISTIFEDKDDSGGQDTDKLTESDSNHKLRLRTLLITISPPSSDSDDETRREKRRYTCSFTSPREARRVRAKLSWYKSL
ncbi:hypothetical protein PC116_g3133 [Phytophthora cactorum]|nr:hypothetical protein PC114_g3273 [Phytophthora cactorum]KAG3025279.1 hypothetical protein PC120_g6594 [Phytophthora cactorum]KAG3038360.1 hypothetical protein PC119_g2946 [Phytophthora cactorum]KAG3201449.1 hypothetical protein PC128_g3897 [Phytophthora cactorum]KAG4062423.1 hypothetical protein PC123_g2715 [Phytophthora cactorum]